MTQEVQEDKEGSLKVSKSEKSITKHLDSKISGELNTEVFGESFEDIRYLNDKLEVNDENLNYRNEHPSKNGHSKKQALSRTDHVIDDSDLSDKQKYSFKKEFSLSRMKMKKKKQPRKIQKTINTSLKSNCFNSIQARMMHFTHRSSVNDDPRSDKRTNMPKNKSSKRLKDPFVFTHSKTHTKNKYKKKKVDSLNLRKRTASLKLFNIDTSFGQRGVKSKVIA